MKNYRIIVDSCCDLTPEMKADERFVSVPLILSVDGVDIVDDDTFDQKDFLARVAASKESPHSACPSPDLFKEEYGRVDGDVYVITLSSELSGSYNSAQLGAKMYKEQGGTNRVHVFNSRSASSGEVLLAKKIVELAEEGKDFNEIVDIVEKFRDEKCTFFVLESLETLRKNGRLTSMQALLINTLNIKPVMRGTKMGTIEKVSQTRGINKALVKMVEIISQEVAGQEEKTLVIAHCNNKERALYVREEVKRLCKFKEIIITDTAGVSSMYANDGGIIVSA